MITTSTGYRLCAVLTVLAWVGCGSGNPEGKHGLSGKIAVDGKPLAAGTISFAPKQQQSSPASTAFRDGEYQIAPEKGLKPGKYVVKIFADSTETEKISPEDIMTGKSRNGDRAEPPRQVIPADYNTNSTQVIEVTADGPNEFDFDIKSGEDRP